jgi:hypothetical protein
MPDGDQNRRFSLGRHHLPNLIVGRRTHSPGHRDEPALALPAHEQIPRGANTHGGVEILDVEAGAGADLADGIDERSSCSGRVRLSQSPPSYLNDTLTLAR